MHRVSAVEWFYGRISTVQAQCTVDWCGHLQSCWRYLHNIHIYLWLSIQTSTTFSCHLISNHNQSAPWKISKKEEWHSGIVFIQCLQLPNSNYACTANHTGSGLALPWFCTGTAELTGVGAFHVCCGFVAHGMHAFIVPVCFLIRGSLFRSARRRSSRSRPPSRKPYFSLRNNPPQWRAQRDWVRQTDLVHVTDTTDGPRAYARRGWRTWRILTRVRMPDAMEPVRGKSGGPDRIGRIGRRFSTEDSLS